MPESDSRPVRGIQESEPGPGLSTISEAIEDIAAGKMVILVDDEDRENEGDLIMAASKVRPEDINFMAHHGRGLVGTLEGKSRQCQQVDTHRIYLSLC